MREILFRGKRTDNGEWVEGWYEMYPFGRWPVKTSIIPSEGAKAGHYEHVEVDSSTVGQYTGLIDKNGKRIWEGDIVAQSRYDFYEPYDDAFGEVMYCDRDCSFSIMDLDKNEIITMGQVCSYHWEAEVIGNIHDNPELLEK